MTDEYGDPEIDLEAEMADAVLRDLLSDFPADVVADPDRVSMIEIAIATGWPDGMPPTVEELAHDPDFSVVMGISEDPGDVQHVADIAGADDHGTQDASDVSDDTAGVVDGWADGGDWDPAGPGEQG